MPHPDDESLSAALDGEDAAASDHVASCPACRARSDALHATAVAVGVGTVLPPGLADRAVAAAMAAYADERAGGSQVAEVDNVVPLRPAGGGIPDSFSSHRPAEGTARRVPGWLMGVAAALVAVLVAVPVIASMGGDGDPTEVAGEPTPGPKASTFAAGPPIEGGDLGDQSDQLALRNRIAGALAGSVADDDESTASAPAAAGAGAEAADASRTAGPDVVAASPAPAPAAPAVTNAPPDADGVGAAGAACEASVAEEYAQTLGLGPMVYRATLTWQGTPAVLLAYRLTDTSAAGADHQAFVMAIDGCRLLVVQGF